MKRSVVLIEYSQTFEHLLNDLISYLSLNSSEESVIIRLEKFIERFERLVKTNPEAAPISHSLLNLGINQFREFSADDFRLIYRVLTIGDNFRIVGDVIVNQRQDLQQLLVNYCLVYK